MWPRGQRGGEHATHEALEVAREARHGGGTLATIVSAVALIFSGFSFYESVLKAAKLSVFVPPQIAYTDPDRPDSPFEVFVLPVTLANDGARSGTVLALELKVSNPRTGKSKRFYAAQFGPWASQPNRPYAPISLAGKAAVSEAVQFFPRVGEKVPRIMDLEPGDYEFELKANLVSAGDSDLFAPGPAKPLVFRMQAGQMDYRNFNGGGTMQMWSPDYQPAASR